jgi:predicted phosphoribosyltransferase
MNARFRDRGEAGRLLAQRLWRYANRPDVLVLALPRGGVPVACEVARALAAPLDILMVRRIAVPHHPHRTMGAIAAGGMRAIDEAVVRELQMTPQAIEHAVDHAAADLARREHAYRCVLFGPYLPGHTIILVDDGVATGVTMRVCIQAARRQASARVVVAVPVAPAGACASLRDEADEVVCLSHTAPFKSIADCYDEFPQVTDEDARQRLEAFARAGGHTTVTCAAMRARVPQGPGRSSPPVQKGARYEP